MSIKTTLAACLLLGACSTSTNYPRVSQDEIAAETQHQLQISGFTERHQRLLRVGQEIVSQAHSLCEEWQISASNCDADFRLDPNKGAVNAWTDGDVVTVTFAMMNFAKTDEDLAFIIGHELSHNIFNHPESATISSVIGSLLGGILDVATTSYTGYSSLRFTQAGSKAGAQIGSRNMERESDYVGLYLAARAGYDVSNAANIWRRLAKKRIKSIYTYGSSHPEYPERYVMLQKTIAEIAQKRAESAPLTPNRKEYAP